MRNNIYRNFLKKVLKSEAFVSLAIVFVLALGIIGTSYALYMDVDTDTDYQVVKVGDLNIAFDKGENTFSIANVTPTDDEIGSQSKDNLFSFYIVNGGSYTANYSIKLVPDYRTTDEDNNPLTPNGIDPEYIRFQICKDNYENCKDIETLSDYVTVTTDENGNKEITESKAIYVDELSPNKTTIQDNNPSAYYFIRMWLTSEGYGTEEYDTNVIGKTIKYKVNIEAKNASGLLDNQNTLAGKLLSDNRVTINNTIPTFDGIADYKVTGDPTSGELGIFKAEDDYGISYYYRGAQSHNYVNFAGFTWRVVRINGDGSIRLILNDIINKSYRKNSDGTLSTDYAGANAAWKTEPYNDNAYIGYIYGTASSDNYNDTHKNINGNDSNIKVVVDKFYKNYIENDSNNYNYGEYLADTLFCGDKVLAQPNVGKTNTATGYGIGKTYYATVERLFYNENAGTATILEKALPSLECAKGANNDFSRYTSNSDKTTKGITVNSDLTYPIGLLSADELVMAGAFAREINVSFYLYTGNPFFTMTPYSGGEVTPETNVPYIMTSGIGDLSLSNSEASDTIGVRPVINLKSDVLWASGDGTIDTPYEVKLY